MSAGETLNLLNTIAEELVLLDMRNLHEVAKFLSIFEQLRDNTKNTFPNTSEVAKQAIISLERYLLADMDKAVRVTPEEITDRMSGLITLLQTHLSTNSDIPKENAYFEQTDNDSNDAISPLNPDQQIFLSAQIETLDQLSAKINLLSTPISETELLTIQEYFSNLREDAGIAGFTEFARIGSIFENRFNPSIDSKSIKTVMLDLIEWLKQSVAELLNGKPLSFPVEILLESIDQQLANQDKEMTAFETPDRSTPVSIQEPIEIPQVVKSNSIAQPDEPKVPQSPTLHPAQEAMGEKPLSDLADHDMIRDFINEASEHLSSAEEKLLELEQNPNNAEAINTVFRAFHTLKGVAGLLGLDDIGMLAHEAENLLDGIRRKSDRITPTSLEASFKSVDFLKRQVNRLAESMSRGMVPSRDRDLFPLIQLIQNAVLNRPAEGTVERRASRSATDAGEPETVSTEAEIKEEEKSEDASRKLLIREPIRVDADRLDRLIDMIGELVIAEAMVQQDVSRLSLESTVLSRNTSQLHKITRELQSSSLSLRMMPVRPVFQKMARMVRDLSKKAEKKIDFVMEGEDTELDKSVVDKIGDPLVHMIRNAVDHGIESSETRVKNGKPPIGTIMLRAFHQGSSIFIELSDDGAGLDRERILEKGRERGLIRPDEVPTDDQLFNLIFHPGFSTARQVTGLSGRGVGMDVVRRNVESLNGSVVLKSTKGHGTTIALRLPLTLAIIDGMLLQVGVERYILPTFSIVESLRLTPGQLTTVTGTGEMIEFRGSMIPLYRMNHLFSIDNGVEDPCEGIVLVVEENQIRVALLADTLLGQYQVVIKNLGTFLEGTKGIAGGAILADGRVGLIVDLHGFLNLAKTV